MAGSSSAADRSDNQARQRRALDDDAIGLAYSLLISRPGLDLAEFAAELGCSEDAGRTVLARLADLALLHRLDTGRDALVAVSPLVAMTHLMAREGDILKQRQTFLQESLDMYSSILRSQDAQPGRSDSDAIAEHLPDPALVQLRLQELATSAQYEIMSLRPSPGHSLIQHALDRCLDRAVLGRGVHLRIIYPDSVAFDDSASAHVAELAEAGADVKLAPTVPMSLIILDGRTAVIPCNPDEPENGALVVSQRAIVGALVALFETHWKLGHPLSSSTSGSIDFTPAEQVVLRLMATGAKDDAVARQLGKSVRSVRRTVSYLMDRAEVGSRFAFGAYASARGWI